MNRWALCASALAVFYLESLFGWGGGLLAAERGMWPPISTGVSQSLADQGKDQGFFKQSGGIVVDLKNSDLYMVMCNQGLWKSVDQGETFQRCDQGEIHGRCETSFSLSPDPAGGRLMCFMIYGSSALTNDAGKTFNKSATSHLDFGAVDWEATGKRMLAYRHESGHTLALSLDGGASWNDLGKGFAGRMVGVLGEKALVSSRGDGIVRSVDQGVTWTKVSDATPHSSVVIVRDGVGYLLSDEGLLVSKDEGATWTRQGAPVKGVAGPFFGKQGSQLVVVGSDGFMETTDGGETWKQIAPLPEGYSLRPLIRGGAQPSFAFDAAHNTLYASFMGKPAYKLQR